MTVRAPIPLLMLLAGCAGAMPPGRTQPVLPANWALTMPSGSALAIRGLLPLDDPAFMRLQVLGQADAPTIEAALGRLDNARGQLGTARADQRPAIDASASGTAQRAGAAQFGSLPANIPFRRDTILYQAGVTASYDLDLFGRLRASRRAAAANVEAALADERGVRLALDADLAGAIVDWRAFEVRLKLTTDDLEQARVLTSVTAERVRAGLAPDSDRVRAASLAADATRRLAQIDADRAEILGRIATLTGRTVADIRPILADPAPANRTVGAIGDVPVAIVRDRPDVAMAEAKLRAADAQVAAAAAQRFPSLTISAAIGLAALALGDLFDGSALTGSVAPQLAGPLLDFGRVGSQVATRRGDARAAFADYRRAVFTALAEVEQAYARIGAADARLAAVREQVRLDEDGARLLDIRYRRGLENITGAIEARRTSFVSRQALADAETEQRAARLALFRATGGAR